AHTTVFPHICVLYFYFCFSTDPATTEIYTLSLHDALPICQGYGARAPGHASRSGGAYAALQRPARGPHQPGIRPPRDLHAEPRRSEEHTSELQSPYDLVCRLLLEKKNNHKLRVSQSDT